MQVLTRARGGRVTQSCHNKPRWETGLQSAGDVTHRKRAVFFGNLKKVRELKLDAERGGSTFGVN